MKYDFDWDPKKAKANARKHQVSFERAATIFRDPHLLSIPDEEHSESEERWITIGVDEKGILLVLVHTFEKILGNLARVRIISARKATKREARQYEEGI